MIYNKLLERTSKSILLPVSKCNLMSIITLLVLATVILLVNGWAGGGGVRERICRTDHGWTVQATDQQDSFTELSRGWDSAAEAIYEKRWNALQTEAFSTPNAITEARIPPTGTSVRTVGSRGKWQAIQQFPPSWEPDTFKTFFKYVDQDTILIDFGTWIGVTILYGVQFADSAYGVEGDPAAFAELQMNIRLNAHAPWYRHIHLQPALVGTVEDWNNNISGVLTMKSAKAGNSCSGVGSKVACGAANIQWNVQSYPLEHLLNAWGIMQRVREKNKKMFVKIDVESYECKLMPDFYSWLLQLYEANQNHLPTFYVSYHPQIATCSEEEYLGLFKVVKLYKFFRCSTDVAQHVNGSEIMMAYVRQCASGSAPFILTNMI